MPRETDERSKPGYYEAAFSKRLASWWNNGAEKASLSQATQVTPETTKREAA
ncbi:hypothetical protein [Adhaeretor mobilis]|uniref:Uncharacterized protein n=1 Tax=Adhaeretor mobilis TaxID=1930276 RepID=A0A517N2C1_9BACT|nr:hypothetical protein [Adhaeretor mobilis]QDT01275.1 hypothetical protein HG15A2_46170 [Adhaeretor mobilis]